jgi:hypothetical protein
MRRFRPSARDGAAAAEVRAARHDGLLGTRGVLGGGRTGANLAYEAVDTRGDWIGWFEPARASSQDALRPLGEVGRSARAARGRRELQGKPDATGDAPRLAHGLVTRTPNRESARATEMATRVSARAREHRWSPTSPSDATRRTRRRLPRRATPRTRAAGSASRGACRPRVLLLLLLLHAPAQ